MDMSPILHRLAESIEGAMVSLYALQTATIKASGGPSATDSKVYGEIRSALKSQWEAILELLKQCHSFGQDVCLLKTSSIDATREDLVDILQEMGKNSSECSQFADSLQRGYDGVIAYYTRHHDHFIKTLRVPLSRTPYVDLDIGIESEDERCPRQGDNPSMNAMSGVLYPDGIKSMTQFEKATVDIQECMVSLAGVMVESSRFCKRCLSHLQAHEGGIGGSEAGEFADSWIRYTEDLMTTIKSVTKV